MAIPVLRIERVLHLGSLDPARKGANHSESYEGDCLSVSLCPDGWRKIARLGGSPLHEMSREGAAFLDIVAAMNSKDLFPEILAWGIAEQLVSEQMLWKGWTLDSETDDWSFSLFESKQAAFDEVGGDYDGPEDVEGPNGAPGIAQSPTLIGDVRLAVLTGMRLDSTTDASVALVMAWAKTRAETDYGVRLDGVWFSHVYDPDTLSAPCGGIFPDRVQEWTAREIPWAEVADDEVELEAMPEIETVEAPPAMHP